MSSRVTDTTQAREIAKSHGVTDSEYQRIRRILGREPNTVEAGIFGVMWSEHCGYKHSRSTLALLPREGKRLLVKAGEENAGAVDIGNGLAVVFKAESHNHPSAVEPHAGAATGVGGIIRDIFTMGARPIALLDSLRFGSLEHERARRLFAGVVKGIADYGNSVGIPTVGGEIYFDDSYLENPLVNVMCIGIVEHKKLARGKATGVGNPVMYVGASTGRDGLGGASFASREITDESEVDRPAVQVGDPFMEKLLLEACLELLESGAIVGIQDMGAAGFTCATCETASRGNSGMNVDVAFVPRRETGMSAYEIMLSESQERMLVIVKKGREKEAERIFRKWDLHGVVVGHVTDDGLLRIREHGKLVAEIPAKALTEQAPVYTPQTRVPRYLKEAQELDLNLIPDVEPNGRNPERSRRIKNPNEVLKKLLSSPTIASKEWVYQQYDHMVRTNTVGLPGSDAAILRIKETGQSLAVSTDCNSAYCYLDPFEGAKIAVAEAARNVSCVGATPIGLTDCLNFGNPEDPEIFWQFRRAVEGIAEACRVLDIPVTGGNVSFYNESPQGAVDPTPMIGVVGLIEKVEGTAKTKSFTSTFDLQPPTLFPTSYFQKEGDLVFLIGETKEELGGSEYLKQIHSLKKGLPPRLDLQLEKRVHQFLREAITNDWIRSAHDCSEGGLAVALAECCVMGEKKMGVEVDFGRGGFQTRPYEGKIRLDALLFGETQSRVVISASKTFEEELMQLAKKHQLPVSKIGIARGDDLKIGSWIKIDVDKIENHWRNAIGYQMSS